MKPHWSQFFGNPSSITKMGVIARQAVENSRKTIANCLSARAQEIFFTSSGTESNNLAIFGVVNHLVSQTRTSCRSSTPFASRVRDAQGLALGSLPKLTSLEMEESKKALKISDLHFITTNIEHSSVSECFRELERRGAEVDYLKVNEKGLVNPADLRKLIKPNTVMVSVHYANNEIGTIQPVREIAKEIRHARKKYQGGTSILFHTDASQAGLYLNLNVQELGVDMMTLDAQKIYGPKGVGMLFVKAGVEISPIIFGGGQEKGLRSGTENVPLVVGMARAIEVARSASINPHLSQGGVVCFGKGAVEKIRNYFWQKIQSEIPEAVLNGDLENRLPNNLNISIPGIDSEFVVLCLDEAGIICSTRSACAHDEDGSAIVCTIHLAQGLTLVQSKSLAKSTLRFSLGEDITKKDIDYVVSTLKNLISR
jgi:cysteine desulfurase